MEQTYLNVLFWILGAVIGMVILLLTSKKSRAIIELIQLSNQLVKKDKIISEKDDRILIEVEKNILLEEENQTLKKNLKELKIKYDEVLAQQKLLTKKVAGFIHLNEVIERSYKQVSLEYADIEDDFEEFKHVMAGLLKEWTDLSPLAIEKLLKPKKKNDELEE